MGVVRALLVLILTLAVLASLGAGVYLWLLEDDLTGGVALIGISAFLAIFELVLMKLGLGDGSLPHIRTSFSMRRDTGGDSPMISVAGPQHRVRVKTISKNLSEEEMEEFMADMCERGVDPKRAHTRTVELTGEEAEEFWRRMRDGEMDDEDWERLRPPE